MRKDAVPGHSHAKEAPAVSSLSNPIVAGQAECWERAWSAGVSPVCNREKVVTDADVVELKPHRI